MAVLSPPKRMAYWQILLNGQEITSLIRQFVESISVEYEVNKPTLAEIDIASNSYIDDFFAQGNSLTIKFGWSRSQLVTMIRDAEIPVHPEGRAADFLSYKVTAFWPPGPTKQEKARTFNPPIKANIVTRIAAENGLSPVVLITDAKPIQAKEMPIQMGVSDFQFLMECAKKWGCLMWVDSTTNQLYFVDATRAHELGNSIRQPNMEDIFPEYTLGYKTDFASNNVASLTWGQGQNKGGKPGESSVDGFSETGRVRASQDYRIEYGGVFYKLKPEYAARAKTDPGFFLSLASMQARAGSSQALASLRRYYDPVHSSRTNADIQTGGLGSGDAINGLELPFELNYGDPYLRPPRVMRLVAGSNSPRAVSSDLPGYLMDGQDKKGTQKYNLRKVKTWIADGMLRTSGMMTR